jgi:hypothetical protein
VTLRGARRAPHQHGMLFLPVRWSVRAGAGRRARRPGVAVVSDVSTCPSTSTSATSWSPTCSASVRAEGRAWRVARRRRAHGAPARLPARGPRRARRPGGLGRAGPRARRRRAAAVRRRELRRRAAFDTLEHVPPRAREAFVASAARRASATCCSSARTSARGRGGESCLQRFLKDKLGVEHRYLEEHRHHGLPDRARVEAQLAARARRSRASARQPRALARADLPSMYMDYSGRAARRSRRASSASTTQPVPLGPRGARVPPRRRRRDRESAAADGEAAARSAAMPAGASRGSRSSRSSSRLRAGRRGAATRSARSSGQIVGSGEGARGHRQVDRRRSPELERCVREIGKPASSGPERRDDRRAARARARAAGRHRSGGVPALKTARPGPAF